MHRFSTLSSLAAVGLPATGEDPTIQRSQASLFARLGLPRLQLATKLYGAIALSLTVVYALAVATTQFAAHTAEAVGRFPTANFSTLAISARLEILLDQQARAIAAGLASPGDKAALDANERAFREVGRDIEAILAARPYGPVHSFSDQYAEIARLGARTLDMVRSERGEQAAASGARFAAAVSGLQSDVVAERQRQVHTSEADIEGLAAKARSLITWVCAAAAATGLLIGPIGLLLLHRVLARLQSVGSALLRLARNDTSVDISGLTATDEIGQLARSAAVFKARSIELLQKKGETERLNLQLDAAINNMPLGLSMFDAQERLLVCNKRFAEMYELPSELTRPGTVHCAVWDHKTRKGARTSDSEDAQSGPAASLNEPGSMIIEFGGQRVISVSRQPLRGGGWVALHEDITQRRRQEEEITHLARHDPLTGLANRALFREQLQQALTRLVRGQGFAVLCLDLDHFKSVNDTLGHPIGDALLKQVGERLLGCVRHGDLVARLGGDEFAIIQAKVRDSAQTETLGQRIVDTIGRPYEIDGHRVDVGTSIGMTLAPRDGDDADQLMRNADLALYRSKSDGRNGFSFFKPEMNDHLQVRRSLEVDLRKAIDEEELELHYQPIVSLATQTITGFEALLRWQHPTRGTIPPSEFVSLAEEIGLISDLGAWAMQRACNQAARWPTPVNVAINLSPLQIKRNLIETVLQALAASGLPPQRLELEITESVLLQDSQNTLSVLHQLRQLGVRITMDDFGTGYASLSYLRSFPFDRIKIDRAFVSGVEHTEESRAVVSAIVSLAERLGMKAIAEGIETYEQQRVVTECGCTEGQGYLFGSAMPAGDVAQFLRDGCLGSQHAA
jgi:diguanylate cyclase (GGDEF)-like protein